jgi:putative spermidine/putrescine transport system substrate-binding protein
MADEGDQLIVSHWGYNMEALEKNLINPFMEEYGIEVVYEVGNNSERLAKVESRKGDPVVDVIHISSHFPFQAKDLGLLQPIDVSKLESYDEIYEWAQDPVGDHYCVAYAVSHAGIIYRTDLVDPAPTSWADLWRDDLAGHITFPDLPTTFGPGQFYMWSMANGGSADDPEPGWEVLPQLAANAVTTYKRSSEMVTLVQEEEVWMGTYGSFALGNHFGTGHPLEIAIPEEGVLASLSNVCIIAGTDNPEMAHKWIDFVLSHDAQKNIALDLIDSPTNKTVELPEDIAKLTTYGPMLDNMLIPDSAYLFSVAEEWQERWNEIMLK